MHQFLRPGEPNECWEWAGYRNPDGYGRLTVNGRQVLAHRWTYERTIGAIPVGLVIDHLCRNRACCNPAHLEPVTHAENVRRGERVGNATCKYGHAFTPENTTWRSSTRRQCRECRRLAAARSRAGAVSRLAS